MMSTVLTKNQNHPVLLRIGEVVQLLGISKPTVYRLMNEGEFPRPIRLSKARVAWLQADLETWLESRPTSEGF